MAWPQKSEVAASIPYSAPTDCCFDATTLQEAIDQLLQVGKLAAIQMDGNAVVGICSLAKWENGTIKSLSKQVI